MNLQSLFIQKCETIKPKSVIIYIPLQNFCWSNLHPRASLFDIYSNVPKAIENMNNAKKMLEEENIKVFSLLDELRKNRPFLLDRAAEVVTFLLESDTKYNSIEEKQRLESFLSDEYKKETLNHYSNDDLVEIILNRPTCHLSTETINTHLVLKSVQFQPMGNMIFCRDHQIITPKGIIICALNSEQRKKEVDLIRWFYQLLEIKPLAEIKGDNRLEGGDFMIIKEDLSLLGVGLRTNMGAASFLMENDLLETKRVGLVVDETDLDQQRMHLDTFFNILSDEEVMLLDMDTVEPKKITDGKVVDLRRRVEIYERSNEKKEIGNYKKVKVMDFEEFLKEEGFRVFKVTNQQQIDFMLNFLNIGNGKIITPNKDLKQFLEMNGSKVEVKFAEFGEVTKMYGGFHCATQAVRY